MASYKLYNIRIHIDRDGRRYIKAMKHNRDNPNIKDSEYVSLSYDSRAGELFAPYFSKENNGTGDIDRPIPEYLTYINGDYKSYTPGFNFFRKDSSNREYIKDEFGKVKVFDSFLVFCEYSFDDFGKKRYWKDLKTKGAYEFDKKIRKGEFILYSKELELELNQSYQMNLLVFDNNKVVNLNNKKCSSYTFSQIEVPYICIKNRPNFPVRKTDTPKTPPTYIEKEYFCDIELEMGYLNTKTFKRHSCEIKIGHVIIEHVDYWECTNSGNDKRYYYQFHLKGEDGGSYIYEHEGSIRLFIEDILPQINKELDHNKNFSEMNIHFYSECSSNMEWSQQYEYLDSYSTILNMIYNCKLKKTKVWEKMGITIYGICIELESPYMYNPYIYWLLSHTISELKFITNGGRKRYVGIVKSLPEYIEKELELGNTIHMDHRIHVELGILASVILNFNKDYCKHGWKSILPIWESTQYVTPTVDTNLYSNYCIFRNLKYWSYIDGQNRVGRDDTEWNEDTYVIPVINGVVISEDILLLIENNMNIKFEYQEDNMRYYCFVQGESDYIPGLARRRGGEVNNLYVISDILKLLLTKLN